MNWSTHPPTQQMFASGGEGKIKPACRSLGSLSVVEELLGAASPPSPPALGLSVGREGDPGGKLRSVQPVLEEVGLWGEEGDSTRWEGSNPPASPPAQAR